MSSLLETNRRIEAPQTLNSNQQSQKMITTLTQRALLTFCEAPLGTNQKDLDYYLQVLHIKEFDMKSQEQSQQKNLMRYRLNLSDGLCQITALLPDSIFKKRNVVPEQWSVIRLNSAMRKEIKGTELLLICDYEIIFTHLTAQIGDPKSAKEIKTGGDKYDTNQTFKIPQKQRVEEPIEIDENEISQVIQEIEPQQLKRVEQNDYVPISQLSTFLRDWVINARITKLQMRDTQKGGKLLKIILVDSSEDKIEGTFFNDAAKQFFPKLKENGVYTFEKGQIKMADKRFTSLPNDFQIIFDAHSKIEEVQDSGEICKNSLNFTQYQNLSGQGNRKINDVAGVIFETSNSSKTNLKSGESKMRKNIWILNEKLQALQLTLWGDQICQKYEEIKVGDVVGISQCKVSEYNGICLNLDDQGKIYVNGPESETNQTLKNIKIWRNSRWAEANGEAQKFQENLSSGIEFLTHRAQRQNETQQVRQQNTSLIAEIEEIVKTDDFQNFIPAQGQPRKDILYLNGRFDSISNQSSIYYQACPECNRKVQEAGDKFECSGCNRFLSNFVPQYMFNAKISDFSGSIYVSFSKENAETVIGMKANQFHQMRQTWIENGEVNQEKEKEFFYSLEKKMFNMQIRAKAENYNGMGKIKFYCGKVFPFEVQKESKSLLDRLQIYSKEEEKTFDY